MTVSDDFSGWLFQMTISDDYSGCLFQMTVPDDYFGWLFQMLISDDFYRWLFRMTVHDSTTDSYFSDQFVFPLLIPILTNHSADWYHGWFVYERPLPTAELWPWSPWYISDFHKLVTVLRSYYKKLPPKNISYRNVKRFEKATFLRDLDSRLIQGEV